MLHNGRTSSGDRARIRRAMHSSRRQTTEVGYVPILPSPPSNQSALGNDPLRSQSQPPSGDAASVQSELSRQRSGESLLLHTESSNFMNTRGSLHGVSTTSFGASPRNLSGTSSSSSSGAATGHLRVRYRSASSIPPSSSPGGQRRSADLGMGSTTIGVGVGGTTESLVGSEDLSTVAGSSTEFYAIAPRGNVSSGRLSVRSPRHPSGEDSPSPQPPPASTPAPSESPVVFRLREESVTLANHLTAPASTAAVNQDPESDHDLYPGESSRLPFRSEDQMQRVFHNLNEMRRQRLLCDVVLKAGELEVPAHKNILAASSPYFHAMFTGDMAESRASVVTIGDIDGAALALLVDFIYTAEVLITEETVQCLLPAANLLQLTSVREACCEFLQCQLHPTNCLGIQRFADMHDCSELLQVSRRFTEQHCGEVLEHGEEFLSLTKEQLISLISNDHIRVSEEQVFEAALRWMRHDVATRGTPEVAAEVCGHVRFGLLPRDYLVRLSQSEDFLRSNPWCKDFLLEAMGFLLLPWEQRRRNITSERTRPRTTNEWTPVADMNHRRSGPAVADLAARIYVVGGHDGLLVRSSAEYYDPRVGVWCSITDMHIARRNAGLVSHNGMLYVVGGDDGTANLDTVETYDPNLNTWTLLPGRLNIARCYAGIALVDCVVQTNNNT
ncbi:unnamed protein product [Hymenolepis diminuta]|uniref:Kelch-like protein 3 n=1 Tax=Hymenolepis diminuta TaxID=6216 RepID=A0A158QFR6_HYMDI|nr:unnamed protein product [Hymenolepis diminuta]